MTLQAAISPAERQRTATRETILDAAFRMLREEPATPFSHETVAQRAGVAPRTVYRHFPARVDLTTALWVRLRDSMGTRWPSTEKEIVPAIRILFRQFEDNALLIRASITASASTGYPVHGSAEGRAAFRLSLSALLGQLPRDEGDRLVASCLAIYSAPFWQMLRDRGQLQPDDAREAGAAAIQAVITAARARVAGRRSSRTRRTK